MVARDVVLQTVQGINGTVFAYGQTGSGKTYTMTGGTARFVDRGIIPRAVALVFGEIASRPDCTYTVCWGWCFFIVMVVMVMMVIVVVLLCGVCASLPIIDKPCVLYVAAHQQRYLDKHSNQHHHQEHHHQKHP